MDDKIKGLKDVFDKTIAFIFELPECGARQQAVIRTQEAVWWCEKVLHETKLAEKKSVTTAAHSGK